jgi:hypothetical protein
MMKEAKDLLTGDSGWGRRMPEGALAAFSFQEGWRPFRFRGYAGVEMPAAWDKQAV